MDTSLRIGIGHDTHRVRAGGPLRLGGVDIDCPWSLVGHSDADVLLHAITDAILGAAALGDIGEMFPDNAAENRGRDSIEMLTIAYQQVVQAGFSLVNLDCIVFAQAPKLSSFKPLIATQIARTLRLDESRVSVKAKTGEGVGEIGRQEVMMAQCVALLSKS